MIETFSWYINFALKADTRIKCHHIWLFLLLEWPFALISNLMKSILSKKTRNAWAISLNWYIEKREGIALKIIPFQQYIYHEILLQKFTWNVRSSVAYNNFMIQLWIKIDKIKVDFVGLILYRIFDQS